MLPPRLLAGASLTLLLLGTALAQAAEPQAATVPSAPSGVTVSGDRVVTPDGNVYFVDPPAPTDPEPAGEGSRQARTVARAPYPDSETFALHSDPSSRRTIFLDFDGGDVSGTYWNDRALHGDKAIAERDYASFFFHPATEMTAEDHAEVQEVWRAVAETYATLDVDVTTEDPGRAALDRTDGADLVYGVRVMLTTDTDVTGLCNIPCAGIAAYEGFDRLNVAPGYLNVAWVAGRRGLGATITTATHEVGHTLGLSHDGRGAAEYDAGQGAWTPVMGSGINAIKQFSNGDYAGATNHEDDFALMTSHGTPRRYDDAGGTTATARTLGARPSYELDGLVTSRGDVDVYRVSHPCGSALDVRATTAGVGSGLDLRLSVLDASGRELRSHDPASGQLIQGGSLPRVPTGTGAEVLGMPAPSGTYFVRVDGVGSTDYSDYGSVGSYRLQVSGCAVPGTTPGAPTSLRHSTDRGTLRLAWGAPATGAAVTGYRVTGVPGGPFEVGPSTTSRTVTSVPGARLLHVAVEALGTAGGGEPATLAVDVPTYAPTAPPTVRASTTVDSVQLSWAPAANPGAAVGRAWRITGGNTERRFDHTFPFELRGGFPYAGLAPGRYKFTVRPVMDAAVGVAPARAIEVTVGAPSAPRSVTAASGASGTPITATARWSAPSTSGAGSVTGYRVVASQVDSAGRVVRTVTSKLLGSRVRAYAFALPKGRYRLHVVAHNRYLPSPASARTGIVSAR